MSSLDTVAEIRQGVLRLARLLRAVRPPDAISLNKISVLSNLRRYGPMYAGELAAHDNQLPQALTRVFAELEDDGLIARIPDETDRRRSLMSLTDSGRDVLTKEMAVRDDWLASVLAELSETEQDVLRIAARLMGKLGEQR